MLNHLSPQDVADALGGALAPARQAHVDRCERCRREVAELGRIMREATAAHEPPDPSPMFWDHFQARVRHATQDIHRPGLLAALPRWRALALAGVGALALVTAVVVGPRVFGPASQVSDQAGATADAIEDPAAAEDVWAAVLELAVELPLDEVQGVTAPRPGATEMLVEQLTVDERAELLRLLEAEMGGGE